MQDNEQIIVEFIKAWSNLDVEELVNYFSEDGCYHNMPTAPISGHADLKKFISGFIANWTSTQWDVLNIMSRDNKVMVERLDRTKVGEIQVDLPCIGVFEMDGGKITVWRDYFDMATYMKPFSA